MANEYALRRVAVDACIFTIIDDRLYVMLNIREKEPYKGMRELIGGLVRTNETAEEALMRKLDTSVVNLPLFFTQFCTFTTPQRDPREPTVSIGFIALVSEEVALVLDKWHPYEFVPNLAFDHKEIIIRARENLRAHAGPDMMKHFMPPVFSLNKLQRAYEIIEGKAYDNRNFRKKMLASGILEDTGDYEENVSHRPARLYAFI